MRFDLLANKWTRASSSLRRARRATQHPLLTSADWDDPAPGFVEAELVAHSGPSTRGNFIQTLVLTDIATGRMDCAPLLVREQRLLSIVLTQLRKQLPLRQPLLASLGA